MAPEEMPTPVTEPASGLTQPQRELNWDELSDTQKIERLRGVVKFLDKQLAEEREVRRELVAKFVTHRHTDNGYVVVPVEYRQFDEPRLFNPGKIRDADRWI